MSKTLEKQVQEFYSQLAYRGGYRVEPWVLTKRDIALLCRYSAALMADRTIRLTVAQDYQAGLLTHGLDHGYVGIEPAHEHQGLAWLWGQHDAGWLGTRELRIMKRFSHFTLAGVATERSGMSWVTTPVFRVHGDDGTFMYEGWSWQSGRKPRLVQ